MARKSIVVEGFRDRLYEAIEDTGLSKTAMAEKCGFSRKIFYDGWESFRSQLNSGYLMKFCSITGVSADWLLGLSKEKYLKK